MEWREQWEISGFMFHFVQQLSMITSSKIHPIHSWFHPVWLENHKKKSGDMSAIAIAFVFTSSLIFVRSCLSSTTAWKGQREVCSKNSFGIVFSIRASWWCDPTTQKAGKALQKKMSERHPRTKRLPSPKKAKERNSACRVIRYIPCTCTSCNEGVSCAAVTLIGLGVIKAWLSVMAPSVLNVNPEKRANREVPCHNWGPEPRALRV